MATVNIGNLTFTHKGDYASGTQYVKNDVVYYSTNGNAYIAKQTTTGNAPTNGTYWSQFAAGSGGIWNAGLSLGSAGQVVKVNSGANALEFGTLSSDYVLLNTTTVTTSVSEVVFDGVFTSTYDMYIMIGQDMLVSSTGSYLNYNHRSSSSNLSTSPQGGGYYGGDDAGNGVPNNGLSNDPRWLGRGVHTTSDRPICFVAYFFDPVKNFRTERARIYNHMLYTGDVGGNVNTISQHGNLYRTDTSSYDGIRFYMASGNITRGKFKLYGLK